MGAGADYAELEVVGGGSQGFWRKAGAPGRSESALLEKPHRGGISQPDASGPGPNSLMGFRHKPAPETQSQKKEAILLSANFSSQVLDTTGM